METIGTASMIIIVSFMFHVIIICVVVVCKHRVRKPAGFVGYWHTGWRYSPQTKFYRNSSRTVHHGFENNTTTATAVVAIMVCIPSLGSADSEARNTLFDLRRSGWKCYFEIYCAVSVPSALSPKPYQPYSNVSKHRPAFVFSYPQDLGFCLRFWNNGSKIYSPKD